MSYRGSDDDRVKVTDIYREQYAHFRSMNDILYKIPPVMTTVIGGLWYFAASYICKDKTVSAIVFLFAAGTCICFTVVLGRFRRAFSGYIDNLNKLDGEFRVTLRDTRSPSTVTAMTWLLWAAVVISFLGAINDIWPFHPFVCTPTP